MNAALFILKRRPGEEPGGFEISSAIPIAGALVCAVLFANRLYQAVVSTDPASRQAPFIALIILAAGFVIGFVHRRIVGTCR
jgi:APA family basic amino acid/polyamine antiporter